MATFITGFSGFVGQNLVKYLSDSKFDQRMIDRETLSSGRFPLFQKGDTIIHLAGKAHDLKNSADPSEYYQVNFELTKLIYDAFINSNAQKFIFLSSVKASADFADFALNEDHTPNPQTDYGKSKLLAERYIQNIELPFGKSYYILRPCMIHGPGNKGNLNLLYKFVSYNIPYILASFQNERSFLSVENLCFSLKEFIVQEDIPSGIYNIADNDTISTSNIVKLIGKVANKKVRLWNINQNLICMIARLGDIIRLPLTTERLVKLTENYVVDNRKIREAIKKELPIKIEEGIKRTIESFIKSKD